MIIFNNNRLKTETAVQDVEPGSSSIPLVRLQPRTMRLLLCLALFLMVAGARWWLIEKYGTDLPYRDQWDAEASNLYKPYFDGTLALKDWFSPHNEHRIFFSRVLALILLLANGQWDARLQMIVNAIIYALVACWLFFILSQKRSTRFAILCAGGLAVIFTLPYGCENTLAGFQSQFYILTAFSLVAMHTLLNSPVWSRWWLVGLILCGATLFTMGSGYLASVAIVGVLTLELIRKWPQRQELARKLWPTAVACAVIVVVGLLLSVRVDQHVPLQAHSVGEFVGAFAANLAFPYLRIPAWSFLSWLPFAIFLGLYLTGRVKDGSAERLILGMGLWVFLQAVAMAFSRAQLGVQSRYTDILSFGLIVNALSIVSLLDHRTRFNKLILFLLVIWLTVNGFHLYETSFDVKAKSIKLIYEVDRIRTAGFLKTGNFQILTVENAWEIPYPDPYKLAELLQDPAIRSILPVGIQASLSMMPAEGSPQTTTIKSNLPSKDKLSPLSWEQTGISSLFAVVNLPQRFQYHIIRNTRLPYLFLHFLGKRQNLSVVDSRGDIHGTFLIPSHDAPWQDAFASCPTKECTIVGMSDASGFILMEPKEIGPLSIGAMALSQWGQYVFGGGVMLFFIALILLVHTEFPLIKSFCAGRKIIV